ncbi:hypothetical protein [Luteolibacter luteus]|uniref:Uncharacterized protein n=1 Tax=Luteolibacter luteus TaxID=2728835 RepID=A0A858RGR6_9BACT|nr:hypothetical protein [Luteolibacter luteus]QJE95718.1 hypothetical protein HHL09_07940 [Luteolibacter luteus]
MKILIGLILFGGSVVSRASLDVDKIPHPVILPGRVEPVWLSYNAFLKQVVSSSDGNLIVGILNKYRDKVGGSSDYISLLVCSRRSENDAWEVTFPLNDMEMSERLGGRFIVSELGPCESLSKLIVKALAPIEPKGKPQMNWEEWDGNREARLKVIMPTEPFAPFPEEK